MKAVPRVDANGLYIEDTIQEDSFSGIVTIYESSETNKPVIIGYFVADPKVTEGLYSPKWDIDNKEWIEGMSQKEIDDLKNQPTPISSDQRMRDLEQQNLSLMDATASMFEQLIDIQDQLSKLSKS